MNKWIKRSLIALTGLVGLAAVVYFSLPKLFDHVASKGPTISIHNSAPQPISNIVVNGSGFLYRVDRIESGQSHVSNVSVKGESGLGIEFESPNGKVVKNDLAYLENGGGYYAELTIDSSYSVHSKSGIGQY